MGLLLCFAIGPGSSTSFLMLWYDTPSGRKLLKALVKALKSKYTGIGAVEIDIPAEQPKAITPASKRRGKAVAPKEPERLLELQWNSGVIPALAFALRLPPKFPAVAAQLTASVNSLPIAKPAPLPHTGTRAPPPILSLII